MRKKIQILSISLLAKVFPENLAKSTGIININIYSNHYGKQTPDFNSKTLR